MTMSWRDCHLRLLELRPYDPIIPTCGACGGGVPSHVTICACGAHVPGRAHKPAPARRSTPASQPPATGQHCCPYWGSHPNEPCTTRRKAR